MCSSLGYERERTFIGRGSHTTLELALVCASSPRADILLSDSNSPTGFYLNLPVGAVTITVLSVMRIPDAKVKVETKHSIKAQIYRLDLLGSAIFGPAIVMILLALDWGGVFIDLGKNH